MINRPSRRSIENAVAALKGPEFRRLDDPRLAKFVATRSAANNLEAIKAGLPAIGSRMVNKFGIEWVVNGHVHLPTPHTIHRWGEGDASRAEDLYPSIVPQNLSPRLTEFVAAVDRCTTKTLLVVDTMPHLREGSTLPGAHSLDTLCNSGANVMFLDAGTVNETILAHEIGHAWVEYVDQCEDYRVLKDTSDPQRLLQFIFVQSFVLDLKVNEVIRRKGFDMSPIEEDQAQSLQNMGLALANGYQPKHKREEVFMALLLASQLLDDEWQGATCLAKFNDAVTAISRAQPAILKLAESLAENTLKHGYDDRESVLALIDGCIKSAFDYSSDPIDLDNDLIEPDSEEPDFDKYAEWLPDMTPKQKCEVGRIMAQHGIPSDSRWSLSTTGSGTRLSFILKDGATKGAWELPFRCLPEISAADLQRRARETNCNPTTPNLRGTMNTPQPIQGRPGRPYMPGVARFITQAQLANVIAGEHPYGYAFDDPVTYVDPSGEIAYRDPGGGGGSQPANCWVRVCTEGGGHFWKHQYVCAYTASGGTCIGSYYYGGVDPKSQCSSNPKTGLICDTFSTSCVDAKNMCSCIAIADKNPTWFWYGSGFCHGASTNLLACMHNGGNWNPPSHF